MSSTVDGLATRLVETIPFGVLVTGADGKLVLMNAAVAELIPLVPDALGRTPLDAIPVPEVANAFRADAPAEQEFEIPSGHRDILVRVRSLGRAGERMAILQDVTKFHTAEQAKSDFVANVSHELRTPATAIAGYSETLLEDRATLDPVVADMIETIHRNARRLISLFDDLLYLAKLDATEGELPLESLDLEPIVVEIMDRLKPKADSRDIMLQTVIPAGFRVMAHRQGLNHVIGNLVDNGIKYSLHGGVVTVRARPYDERALVEVIDVGHGIDPLHHKRIFERFYRVDKGRAREAGGTGLGLSIVKRLVVAMGGDIEVRSRPGRGSVFRVFFRARADS